MDTAVIKAKQQAAWASGDYAAVGSRLLPVAELLVEAVDLRAGERVLDVATGNGNAALAAARRFAHVTGVDYVPWLLDRAQRRAQAEGFEIDFRVADAESLPFDDGAFDVVLSTCGAMFAPDQEQAARELARVVRPGGRIGMVNWTPDSYVGELFRAIGRYLPPPAGLRAPVEWGEAARLAELFPGAEVTAPRRVFRWRFPSAEHQAAFFVEFYGPTNRAVAALGEADAAGLRAEMVELARRFDESDDDTLVLRMDYLEVVVRAPGDE